MCFSKKWHPSGYSYFSTWKKHLLVLKSNFSWSAAQALSNDLINAKTSDLNPSVMCTSKSENVHSLCFSSVLCPRYFILYTTKLERKTNKLREMWFIKTAVKEWLIKNCLKESTSNVSTNEILITFSSESFLQTSDVIRILMVGDWPPWHTSGYVTASNKYSLIWYLSD